MIRIDNIVFNGIDSRALGLKINRMTPFAVPPRRVTQYIVPGRNGSVIVDDGTFDNVQLDYGFAKYGAKSGDVATANAIKVWVCQDGQYHRLEDSRWPDHYMMAAALAPEITQVGSSRRSVEGVLHFECLPEKWLKSGETAILLDLAGYGTPSVIVDNPTIYTAHPVIVFPETEKTLTVRVRQSTWFGYAEYTVISHDGEISLDTFTGNAVYLSGPLAGFSANYVVSVLLNGPDEFELRAGESEIHATISVPEAKYIKVYPRWWEI